MELIDETIVDACPLGEALRLIHFALLCVQEDPNRPTMSRVILMLASKTLSRVILMLASKTLNLPQPSAPPFSVSRLIIFDQSSTIGNKTGFVTSDQSLKSAFG